MTGWQNALDFTLKYEGGWVDDPHDLGGETFRGISRRNWPNWAGWARVDELKALPDFISRVNADNALEPLVEQFYYTEFWTKIHGDELPNKMAVAVFDFAVNSGSTTACRMLQVALGVGVDGVIGPKTVKAAHDGGEPAIIEFMARRAKFLYEIMDKDPGQAVWAMNWFRRMFKLANVVLED